jgi:hypothetical protein
MPYNKLSRPPMKSIARDDLGKVDRAALSVLVEARLNPDQKIASNMLPVSKALRSLTSRFPEPTMLLYGLSSSMKSGL